MLNVFEAQRIRNNTFEKHNNNDHRVRLLFTIIRRQNLFEAGCQQIR